MPTITPINTTLGYQIDSITVNANGSVAAQISIGTQPGGAAFIPLTQRSYLLSAEDAASALATPGAPTTPAYQTLAAAVIVALGPALSQLS